MSRKLIGIAILAALTLPVAAQAEVTRADLRHDTHAVRQERREVIHAVRTGHPAQARAERRELRDAKHTRRHDRRAFARDHHRRR
jgi:hypothetical protein